MVRSGHGVALPPNLPLKSTDSSSRPNQGETYSEGRDGDGGEEAEERRLAKEEEEAEKIARQEAKNAERESKAAKTSAVKRTRDEADYNCGG